MNMHQQPSLRAPALPTMVGYQHMQVNNKLSLGTRPMVVILVKFGGLPALEHDGSLSGVSHGGTIWTKTGTRREKPTLSKRMTIQACGRPVTIGGP